MTEKYTCNANPRIKHSGGHPFTLVQDGDGSARPTYDD